MLQMSNAGQFSPKFFFRIIKLIFFGVFDVNWRVSIHTNSELFLVSRSLTLSTKNIVQSLVEVCSRSASMKVKRKRKRKGNVVQLVSNYSLRTCPRLFQSGTANLTVHLSFCFVITIKNISLKLKLAFTFCSSVGFVLFPSQCTLVNNTFSFFYCYIYIL